MAVDEGCSTLWVLQSTAAQVGRLTHVLRVRRRRENQRRFKHRPSSHPHASRIWGRGRHEGGNGPPVRTAIVYRFTSKNYLL